MKILIIAIGHKLPNWLNEGIHHYTKRFASMNDFDLSIKEIPAQRREKSSNIQQIVAKESQALIDAIPPYHLPIALDVNGRSLSSEQLAKKLERCRDSGDNLAILIGGPEGFNETVRQHVRERWSLSNLTLPHPIARLVLTETLYRSVSILHHHPYHRSGEQ